MLYSLPLLSFSVILIFSLSLISLLSMRALYASTNFLVSSNSKSVPVKSFSSDTSTLITLSFGVSFSLTSNFSTASQRFLALTVPGNFFSISSLRLIDSFLIFLSSATSLFTFNILAGNEFSFSKSLKISLTLYSLSPSFNVVFNTCFASTPSFVIRLLYASINFLVSANSSSAPVKSFSSDTSTLIVRARLFSAKNLLYATLPGKRSFLSRNSR